MVPRRRFFEFTASVMDDTEIVERLRIIGSDGDGAAAGGKRIIETAGQSMHLAKIAMVERHGAVGFDRAADEVDRGRNIPGPMRNEAA
jgi:hypothetical protein